jgi:VWFA-related protein
MTAAYSVWICLLALPLSMLARQSGPVPAPVADKRITLDVVVNDKSGKPVAGLQQQDFSIFDNKQPRPILSFEGFGDAGAAGQAEIVLVLDSVNTSFTRVATERVELKKFLQRDEGRLARPISIAFFSDAGVSLQPAPSRDGNALVAELDQNPSGLRTIRRSEGYYGAAERWQLSVRAVYQLCKYESKRPGRKIIIWISPGWPILSGPGVQLSAKDQAGAFKTIVELSTLLRQSRVAFYSVNPLGADSPMLRTQYYKEFLKGVKSEKAALYGDMALQVLAFQSGGRVFDSENDVAGEIERCVRDVNAYYVISFDPIPPDGPNDYHPLEVRLATPGLKAQTRAGYYGQP